MIYENGSTLDGGGKCLFLSKMHTGVAEEETGPKRSKLNQADNEIFMNCSTEESIREKNGYQIFV
jgi:hypothetical protein